MGAFCSYFYGLFRQTNEYEVISNNNNNIVSNSPNTHRPSSNTDGHTYQMAPYQAHPINSSVSPVYGNRGHNDVNNVLYDPTSTPITTQLSYQQPKVGFFIQYELKDTIGVGSTSKCYSCTRKSDGKEFAAKVIDKKEIEAQYSGMLDQCTIEIKVIILHVTVCEHTVSVLIILFIMYRYSNL